VLNRIRRAASLARERYFPKGRHRRPLRPSRPTLAPAGPGSRQGGALATTPGGGHRTCPSVCTGA
jgi:hypothetical protein